MKIIIKEIINPVNDFINKKEEKEKSVFELRNINCNNNLIDNTKLNNNNLDISYSTGNLQELYSILNKRKIEREKEKEKKRITQLITDLILIICLVFEFITLLSYKILLKSVLISIE